MARGIFVFGIQCFLGDPKTLSEILFFRYIKRLVRDASGWVVVVIRARALPYFWVEARLFLKSFLFCVVFNVLFDRPLVFRFFQVVFSVFPASFSVSVLRQCTHDV